MKCLTSVGKNIPLETPHQTHCCDHEGNHGNDAIMSYVSTRVCDWYIGIYYA